jgi:hypothetical protein
MTRKPLTQGDEDGLCGLYSIINALTLLFPGAMNHERKDEVFKAIAKACKGGIEILWNGTTEHDIRLMLHAARNTLIDVTKWNWEQPFARASFKNFREFSRELKWRIEGDDAFAVVGISVPWEHWTCAHRLTDHEMIMTDSCHVKQIPLDKCGLAGDGADYEFDYHQTFTLMKDAKKARVR